MSQPTFARLTIARKDPGHKEDNVTLKIVDIEGHELTVVVDIRDWSRALLLHKPVTAWIGQKATEDDGA